MTPPSREIVECHVAGSDKLPAGSGGADAFCAAIRHAAEAQIPTHRFKVEARVKGPSLMTATVTTADGVKWPEEEYGISDRGFDAASLERFATNLVTMVARAASRPKNAS